MRPPGWDLIPKFKFLNHEKENILGRLPTSDVIELPKYKLCCILLSFPGTALPTTEGLHETSGTI